MILYPVNNFFLKSLLLTILLLRICVGTHESLSTRGGQGTDWETGFLVQCGLDRKSTFIRGDICMVYCTISGWQSAIL